MKTYLILLSREGEINFLKCYIQGRHTKLWHQRTSRIVINSCFQVLKTNWVCFPLTARKVPTFITYCFISVKSSAWTSSHIIELEFHRAGKLWVWTHIEFCEYEFFGFKLEFRDKFAKHFEYFKFCGFPFSIFSKLQTIKLKFHQVWNLIGKTC